MRKVILAYLVILFANSVQAKNSLDSLFQELRMHPSDDSFKMELLIRIGENYQSSNMLLTTKYYKQALALAEKIPLSDFYIARIHGYIGQTYTLMGDVKNSLSYNLEAGRISLKNRDTTNYVYAMNNIANMYMSVDMLDKSFEYLDKEAKLLHGVKNITIKISHHYLKGTLLGITNKTDSALVEFYKCLKMSSDVKDYETVAESHIAIAQCHHDKGNYDSARYYYSLVTSNKNLMPLKFVRAYNLLAEHYYALGQLENAKKALDSSNNYGVDDLNEIMINYQTYASIYKDQKDFQQYGYYLEKYYQLKDSLFNSANQSKLNQLEQNFMQAQNDEKLAWQRKLKQLYALLALIFLLSAFGVVYLLLRSNQKKKQIEAQKNEISLQKDELVQLNNTKDKLFSVISHDLRNPLVTLSNYLDAGNDASIDKPTLEKNKVAVANSLQHSISLLDNLLTWAYSQLNTHQPLVNRIDMKDWLEEVRAVVEPQAMQKQIQIHTEIKEGADNFIGDENMLSIVMRNVLTNAIKFSNAGDQIEILAQPFESKIQLSITDHGIGIDPEKLEAIKQRKITSTTGTANEKGSGLGLNIVVDLLQKMNIVWDLKSSINKGTTFTLLLPDS